MKTKSGEEITTKEFFNKWKQGMQMITPLQQTKISLIGNAFVLTGVIIGIIIMIITRTWWLLIILIGSLILVSVGALGSIQKYWALKEVDKLMKGGINENGEV